MGRFEVGHAKRGGRQKNTPNRPKKILREIVEDALGGKSIPERLMELSEGLPAEESAILLALLPYCYPKMSAVAIEATVERPSGGETTSRELGDLIEHLAKLEREEMEWKIKEAIEEDRKVRTQQLPKIDA